jgi:hypothetical protein
MKMEDDIDLKVPSPWTDIVNTLVKGGLPQIIAGPAGKSLSRLIAGATDIPAAWLAGRAQRIKDKTEGRTVIMKALALAAANAAVSDPALLDRALEQHIQEIYRKQVNKEAIAIKVMEDIASDPLPQTSAGPSDEWLDVFERDAANATSERLRDLYSRILGGEIRKPGAFSLSTLRVLTILDTQLASIFERILPFRLDENFLPSELIDNAVPYRDVLELEAAGILLTGGGMMQLTKMPAQNDVFIFMMKTKGFGVRFQSPEVKKIRGITLTRAGIELAGITSVREETQAMADYLWAQGAVSVQLGTRIFVDGQHGISNLVSVPRSMPS